MPSPLLGILPFSAAAVSLSFYATSLSPGAVREVPREQRQLPRQQKQEPLVRRWRDEREELGRRHLSHGSTLETGYLRLEFPSCTESQDLSWYMNCSSPGILQSATTNMSCGSPFLGSATASKGQDGHLDKSDCGYPGSHKPSLFQTRSGPKKEKHQFNPARGPSSSGNGRE